MYRIHVVVRIWYGAFMHVCVHVCMGLVWLYVWYMELNIDCACTAKHSNIACSSVHIS